MSRLLLFVLLIQIQPGIADNRAGVYSPRDYGGRGEAFKGPYKVRPYMLRIINCKNVNVRDLTMVRSPMWVQHYLACENVNIDGITVDARRHRVNNDGIDIDNCEKVRISNCYINSGDDAVVLKSTTHKPCRFVTVTNCVLSSATNAFKPGTESDGGGQNIVLDKCVFYNSPGGILLEEMDGGMFNRVSVSNVTMDSVAVPIFIRLGNRARPVTSKGPGGAVGTFEAEPGSKSPGMGGMQNILISNIQADNCGPMGCSITGLPGFPVRNVTLQHIRLRFGGGGTAEQAHKQVPEFPGKYPGIHMFGTLPAWGFFCRHVENVRLHHLELYLESKDARSALIFDDVKDLDILNLVAASIPSRAVMDFRAVRHAQLSGCKPAAAVKKWLSIDAGSQDISILNNDFSHVDVVVESENKNNYYLNTNRLK